MADMHACMQLTGGADGDGKEGDEILAELEKKQAELASIVSCQQYSVVIECVKGLVSLCVQMEYNREQREVLLSLAKAEMKRQQDRAAVKEVSSS